MTLPLLETFTDPSRLKALAIAAGGDINSAAAECYLRVADGLGVLDEAALALATAMDAPEADPSLGQILRRIDAAEGAGELTDPAIVNPLRRINGEDPDGYVMARYHMRARELGADKAVMEAVGAVTITPAEERVGSIGKYRTKGTGPAWRRLARGIEGTPSDGLLLAIADAAGRADASFDEVMKELDGSAPLPDWFGDVLALALFEGEMRAWNAPVAEWRRESLMHVSTEALRAAVWNWVDDSSKHLRLVISDMGGGKTRAMVRKIGKRIREKEVDGRLRIDDQQAAIYVLVPTVVLGEEIIKLLEAEPLIRSYLIRGRSQPAPEPDEEGKACGMCRKKTMPTLASVSGLDTFSALCKRGGVTCDHFDLCAWSRQSGDIIRGDCNVIVATHPFLAIRPLAGMPIPKPEMLFIDESPLKHVKRTERRRIATLDPLHICAADVKVVMERFADVVVPRAEARVRALEAAVDAASELIEARDRLRLVRRVLKGLDRMRRWIASVEGEGLVSLAEAVAWFDADLPRVGGILRGAEEAVLSPADNEATAEHRQDTEKANALRQVRDFVENVLAPGIGRPIAPGLAGVLHSGWLPAAETIVRKVKEQATGKTHDVPSIRFAWLAEVAPFWSGVETVLIDGTPDVRMVRRLFPGIEISPFLTAKWKARVLYVPDSGFSKSGMMKPAAKVDGKTAPRETKSRGEEVRTFWRFIRAHVDPDVAIVSHQDFTSTLRKDFDEDADPPIAHFGSVRGTNRFEGRETLIVCGGPEPGLGDTELSAEATTGHAVERKVGIDGRPPQYDRTTTSMGGAEAVVNWHDEPACGAYLGQVRVAEKAQSVSRGRPLDNEGLIIILGGEIDFIGDSASIEPVDWDLLRPTIVDRMLAETGIAIGGEIGRRLFPWLSVRASNRVGGMLFDGSGLQDMAAELGKITSEIRVRDPSGAAFRRPARAITLLPPAEAGRRLRAFGLEMDEET